MSCFTQIVAPPQSHVPPHSNCENPKSRHRKQTISLLKNCRNVSHITRIHSSIVKIGQQHDDFIIFELLRVCLKFRAIDYALQIFQQTQRPNIYVYTSLIDGLVSSGLHHQGINAYIQMIKHHIDPDNFVISSVLKACGLGLDLTMGKEVHAQVVKLGLCSNRSVRLKLLELYGKCGELEDMKKMFDEMPDRDAVAMTVMISSYLDHELVGRASNIFNSVVVKDTVCWTAMIDGLERNGEMSKALEYFRQMQREGIRANEVTIVCVLSVCAHLGALGLGEWVHSYIEKYDIEINHIVGSALINMYSKCGNIEEAERVFEGIKEREVSTYNSMIVGYALNGKSVKAVEIFCKMIKEGICPTNITFVGVLNACSHGGLVDIGFRIFQSMLSDHGIEPQIEHYGCLVDLLGRVGRVEEAYSFVQNMKVNPDHIIWASLLNACKIHKKYELGEKVAKILLNNGFTDTGTYILLSNFYSSWGKWEEALLVRENLKESYIQKEPGCSSIEINNEVHEFMLGDTRHPEKKAIYRKLEEIDQKLRLKGYCPQLDVVSQDIMDQEKERAVAIHSERLALCYGLISTEPHSVIRIVKNLRVCNDCHMVIKLVSEIGGQKIIMRDRNRFHHFENGSCSCGDYW